MINREDSKLIKIEETSRKKAKLLAEGRVQVGEASTIDEASGYITDPNHSAKLSIRDGDVVTLWSAPRQK